MSADLVAIIALIVLVDVMVFLPDVSEPYVRAVAGIAFVLFVPGYALVAALFPEAGRSRPAGDGDEWGTTVDRFFTLARDSGATGKTGAERVALAFALSIALVPLLMLGLSVSPYGFRLVPIFVAINAVTAVCTGVAAIRRWSLPEDERFQVPYGEWLAEGRGRIVGADSRFNAFLNVALAVAILFAVGTLTFAVVAPSDGEQFTEFYVLTDDGNGELVAGNYPEYLSPDEPELLYVGVENYEEETVEYSVVVQIQRQEGGGANESAIEDRAEVDRFSVTLGPNETTIREEDVVVPNGFVGEDLRLEFLLYVGSVPDTPTRKNAYRSLHLWVDVATEAQ